MKGDKYTPEMHLPPLLSINSKRLMFEVAFTSKGHGNAQLIASSD